MVHSNGQQVLMISIHDYTDAILYKTLHLQNVEDLERIDMMQGEMARCQLLQNENFFPKVIKTEKKEAGSNKENESQ